MHVFSNGDGWDESKDSDCTLGAWSSWTSCYAGGGQRHIREMLKEMGFCLSKIQICWGKFELPNLFQNLRQQNSFLATSDFGDSFFQDPKPHNYTPCFIGRDVGGA